MQTQPKSGHLRGVSNNQTKRTGRPDGQKNVQEGGRVSTNYEHQVQTNPTNRSGRDVPPQDLRGFVRNDLGRKLSPRDVSASKRKAH